MNRKTPHTEELEFASEPVRAVPFERYPQLFNLPLQTTFETHLAAFRRLNVRLRRELEAIQGEERRLSGENPVDNT